MLIRQTKDTFIRRFGNIGYITNQLTKHDRNYNETGADLLDKISREPKEIDQIVEELLLIFQDISFDALKADFIEFLEDLEKSGFILIGKTPEILNEKEPSFSYKSENPRTSVYNFSNPDLNEISADSSDFLFEEFSKVPRIFDLQIEISSRCNERCVHCYIPYENKENGHDINLPLILRVMDEAREMGTLQITLSGGELFLHRHLSVILDHARENDFVINILSNLTLLTDEHIKLLKIINPSVIQVSLYSLNPNEHDAITSVKGSFNKTINSIERLVKADIPVQISCPVMKINRRSYKDVLQYAKKQKVKAQTDFIMMAQADCNIGNLVHRISIDETAELLNDLFAYDKDYTNLTLNQDPKSKDMEKYKKMPVCGVGIDSICLASNGDYYPCAGWQGMILGNANEKSLSDIWNQSQELNQLRKISYSSFPQCIICDAKDYCTICLVRNYNENQGDMFKITKHFCDVAFLTKKMVENYHYEKMKI